MIAKILQTEGINADWINAGALTIKDASGKIIFSVDTAAKKVSFVNGYFDSTGAHFTNGYFSGTITSANISGTHIEGAEIFSGSFSTIPEGEVEHNSYIRIEDASVLFGMSQEIIATDYVLYEQDIDGSLWGWGVLENIDLALTQCATVTMDGSTWAVITNKATTYNTQQKYTETGAPIYNGFNLYADLIAQRMYTKGTKSRISDTVNYGTRALYCYETTTPYFGDIGTAIINSDGFCTVSIDDIFSETVNCDVEYQVFLQKEGPGDLWISEKTFTHFTVEGKPNLSFSWELKAVQKGFETLRIDDMYFINTEIDTENELLKIADQEISDYDSELEGLV